MNPNHLYLKAMKLWGKELQLIVCMEELSELIKEISKTIRQKEKSPGLIGEMADVTICIESMKIMLGITEKELKEAVNYKMERLEFRVKQAGEK